MVYLYVCTYVCLCVNTCSMEFQILLSKMETTRLQQDIPTCNNNVVTANCSHMYNVFPCTRPCIHFPSPAYRYNLYANSISCKLRNHFHVTLETIKISHVWFLLFFLCVCVKTLLLPSRVGALAIFFRAGYISFAIVCCKFANFI